MDLIKKWLSGNKNFIVGAILYKKFGGDEKLKKLFDGKPDAYLQKRLVEELEKLSENKKPVAANSKKQKANDAAEMPESSDPVLKALRNEWLKPYQRMKYLQGELDRVGGSEAFPLYDVDTINSPENIAKRKPIAFEILELEQQCMAVWRRRSYYEKEGKLPEVKNVDDDIPTDPIELGKLIEGTKRNIRRNKQLMAQHPDNPKYPLLQKQYEEKLERIMKKVNNGKQLT